MNRMLLAVAAALALGVAASASAQSYPTNNPVYIPTPVLAQQSLSAAGTVGFNSNNVGDTLVRFSGSETGLAATIQCTESRASSPTWSNLTIFPVGATGSAAAPIDAATGVTANGLYRVNSAACAQVRVNVTATTGAVNIAMSGGLPQLEHFAANLDYGAVITNTARVPATVHSADLTNFSGTGVMCVFNQTAHASSPSTTYSIEAKDSASGAYVSLLTSAANTADATPSFIVVHPGVAETANVSTGLPIPRTFRVTEVVGGTGSTTGTIGCHVLN